MTLIQNTTKRMDIIDISFISFILAIKLNNQFTIQTWELTKTAKIYIFIGL